ncbi:hypothetical protein BH10PSE19_BH10PSE19_10250 [soil metagenome]
MEFALITDDYRGVWYESDYASVKQKWLLVKSKPAERRENHSLRKKLLKNTVRSRKSFKKVCQQKYSCRIDAGNVLALWEGNQDTINVAEGCIIEQMSHASRGRPKANVAGKTYYQISGLLYSSLDKKAAQEEQNGFFILATNDCSGKLSMQAMLENYKSQQAVERGFRFLKSPDFLTSSLFLKNPERIEALLMIMTCCLMVYAALEHLIRRELKAKNLFFPDMKKKPTQKPRAKWVFWCLLN